MTVATEQFASANKAGVEMLLGIANTQFAAFERLSALNFNATKAAFEAGIGQTKALLGAKDIQDLVNLNASAAQPNLESAIAYSRSVYELSTQTQAEMTKFIESQAAEFNKNMVAFLDRVSKAAPPGSDVIVAAVKSGIAAANSAYDNISKISKQATEMAEANFAAATSAAKEARKKAA